VRCRDSGIPHRMDNNPTEKVIEMAKATLKREIGKKPEEVASPRTDIKRLYRSKENKVLAGVCGGIAEYFNIDPVWVRLIAVLLTFADGIGIMMYLIAWILIPVNPDQKDTPKTEAERVAARISDRVERRNDMSDSQPKGRILIGAIIILIGLGFLFKNLFWWFKFEYVLPLAVIAIGLFLVFRRSR
jgi:phage shock protein C